MIGHGTEVRQVLMMDGSSLPHLNLFFTSLLGNRVRVGGGTYTANFLLSAKEISVRFTDRQGRRHDHATGRTLFGSVVGDGAVIGAQTLLLPGALVGRGAVAMPQKQISGYVPPGWKVVPEKAPFRLEAPQEVAR
jgi:bifunctional UDP-N-acetylglucosamine pyrophosphorylase/glucosamine-1-phosphate N-acetyltransferase